MIAYLIKKDQKDHRSSSYYVVAELSLSMRDLKSLLKDPKFKEWDVKHVIDFEEQVLACHVAYQDRSRKAVFTKADIEKDQDSRQKGEEPSNH